MSLMLSVLALVICWISLGLVADHGGAGSRER